MLLNVFKKILEATLKVIVAAWPLTSLLATIQLSQKVSTRHCWNSKDELISSFLLWTPTHGYTSVGRLDTVRRTCQERWAIEKEGKRESMNFVLSTRLDNNQYSFLGFYFLLISFCLYFSLILFTPSVIFRFISDKKICHIIYLYWLNCDQKQGRVMLRDREKNCKLFNKITDAWENSMNFLMPH